MAKKKRKKSKGGKGSNQGQGWGNGQQQATGLFGGLSNMLPAGRTEQFLLGAVIGAAAAYVLSDEEMRGKMLKAGLKLYSGLAGGVAEMKEQMADIKAEVEAEQSGAL